MTREQAFAEFFGIPRSHALILLALYNTTGLSPGAVARFLAPHAIPADAIREIEAAMEPGAIAHDPDGPGRSVVYRLTPSAASECRRAVAECQRARVA